MKRARKNTPGLLPFVTLIASDPVRLIRTGAAPRLQLQEAGRRRLPSISRWSKLLVTLGRLTADSAP